MGGAIVSFAKKPRPAEIGRPSAIEAEENIHLWPRSGTFCQVENSDGEASADSLRDLLGRVSATSTGEIDNLINELQALRRKRDSDRIKTDIAKYTALSEQVMQVTKIAFESVQKLPEAPSIGA